MTLAIYGSIFGVVAILGWVAISQLQERVVGYVRSQALDAQTQLSDIFVDFPPERLELLYAISPIVIGLVVWVASNSWIGAVVGGVIGLLLPTFWIRRLRAVRHSKFHRLMVDCMLLMSSSLRAGLSLVQAFKVVTEEMPEPLNQEFALVLKEISMGISLEEAMMRFKKRLASDDVNLFVTAVLVARETGGDITSIFTKLVETLRERAKIREKIKTLTFMAKMQGVIMALLPVIFIVATYSMDKTHFTFFLQDPTGKLMLGGVVLTQLFVLYLFMRFSRAPLL